MAHNLGTPLPESKIRVFLSGDLFIGTWGREAKLLDSDWLINLYRT